MRIWQNIIYCLNLEGISDAYDFCIVYFTLVVSFSLMCDVVFLWCNVWQSVLTVLSKEQFSTVTFNQQAPVALQTRHAETSNTSIDTHCIFRHSSGHLIHLVIFHERGNEQFLWHGSLPNAQHLDLTLASTKFGMHEGAYNRWELSLILGGNLHPGASIPSIDNVRAVCPLTSTQFHQGFKGVVCSSIWVCARQIPGSRPLMSQYDTTWNINV